MNIGIMGNSGKCIHYSEKVANMTKHVQETHGYTTITAQKKKKERKKKEKEKKKSYYPPKSNGM